MKTFRLARIAAQAEGALVRRVLHVAARRAALGAIAALFGVFLLAALHALGTIALIQYAQFSTVVSLGIVAGIDFGLAAVFGLLAGAKSKDPVADDARALRDQAIEGVRQSLSAAAMLRHVFTLLGEQGLLRMIFRGMRSRGKG